MMGAKPFERQGSEVILETPIFTLRQDRCTHPETGREGSYFILEQPTWVNVVALEEGGEALLMVRQWRHGTRTVELEVPAGLVDPGEEVLVAAARELREETGCEARSLEVICVMAPNPAIQDNRCHVVLATGCHKVGEQALDEGEQIEVVRLPVSELRGAIERGELRHGIALLAIYRWLDHSGRVTWP